MLYIYLKYWNINYTMKELKCVIILNFRIQNKSEKIVEENDDAKKLVQELNFEIPSEIEKQMQKSKDFFEK